MECFGTATFWSVLECTIVKSKECRSRCRSRSFCCDILVSKSPQCFTPGKCYKVKSTNDPILTRLLGLSPRSTQRLSPQRLKRFQHYLQGTTILCRQQSQHIYDTVEGANAQAAQAANPLRVCRNHILLSNPSLINKLRSSIDYANSPLPHMDRALVHLFISSGQPQSNPTHI